MIIEFFDILNLDLDDKFIEGGYNATSFQVILYEDNGDIKINYGPETVPGRMFAVGIENKDGSYGLSYPGLKTNGSNEGLSVLFYKGDFIIPDPVLPQDPDPLIPPIDPIIPANDWRTVYEGNSYRVQEAIK